MKKPISRFGNQFDPLRNAILITSGMTITVLAALAFEHVGGYLPCALCLRQRVPYYLGIIIGIASIGSCIARAPLRMIGFLFSAIALTMVVGMGLGVRHAGIEWDFWQGPSSCDGTTLTTDAGKLLTILEKAHGPSCTEAAFRDFFGLSMAGWNVIASFVLAIASVCYALRSFRPSFQPKCS